MRTKNSKPFSPAERAHHIKQGCHFTTVALCQDCHQGSINGWHGQKRMWLIYKMDEIDALNVTLQRLGQGLMRAAA